MPYEMEIKDEAIAVLRSLPDDARQEIGYRLHRLQDLYCGFTERCLSMSTPKKNGSPAKQANLDRQIRSAKVVLRNLRDTLETLEDRRELAKAKTRNAGKLGVSWEAAKKELGLDF
jgi:hypothetical protein